MDTLLDQTNQLVLGALAGYAGSGDDGDRVGSPKPRPPGRLPEHAVIVVEMASFVGLDVFWTGFALFAFFSLVFIFLTRRAPFRMRLLHFTTAVISIVAALSYYAMATKLGVHYVLERVRMDVEPELIYIREIQVARYVDYAITMPMLLLDLALVAGMSIGEIIVLLAMGEGMEITALLAAIHPIRRYAWGFYAFSCVFFVAIVWTLLTNGRKSAHRRSPRVGGVYTGLAFYLSSLWTLYPICFALGEGAAVINVDAEVTVYAILDLFTKPIFGLFLLVTHARVEEALVLLPEYWIIPSGSISGGAYGPVPVQADPVAIETVLATESTEAEEAPP